MLTKKQLKKLRDEIVLNSLFLKDYDNTLFIKRDSVCSFFNSFIEYIEEIYTEKHGNSASSYDELFKEYDNINTLYDYYRYMEYDPLLQDDFIASMHINNSDSIVIYHIEDIYSYHPCIYVAYHLLSGLYYRNTPIKKYRLYQSVKRGCYFMLNRKRYYLDQFIRCDYGRDE